MFGIDIDSALKQITQYVDQVVGGNEFAAGAIIAWLLAVGAYLFRDIPVKIFNFALKHTTTTMELNNTHEAFYVLGRYLEHKDFVAESRIIKISNGRYGNDNYDGKKVRIKEIGYGTQVFWYKWYAPLKISVSKEDGSVSQNVKEFIHIVKLGRSHKLFDNMIDEAYNYQKVGTGDMVKCYNYGSFGESFVAKQPRRKLDSVILPEACKERVENAVNAFINREQWYLDHNIPYQLGILLYGPPGTGKTTLIKALATLLDRDICFVKSADKLSDALEDCHDKLIVAEEIDTMSLASRDEDEDYDTVIESKIRKKKQNAMAAMVNDINKGMLGVVLNALDGVISHHGRVIVMTTNDRSNLDAALLRPGRIDLQLELGHLTSETFNAMLQKFFKDYKPRDINLKEGIAHVDVQNDIVLEMKPDELIEKYTVE